MNTNIKQIAQELQSYGRNGDTMLAHITPEEAEVLSLLGGSGTINPNTGLPEYWGGFGGFIGDVFGGAADLVGSVVGGIGDVVGSFVDDPAKFAKNIANSIMDDPLKALATGAVSYFGLPALSSALGAGSIGTSALADAAFIADDVASLAAQGISPAQMTQILEASGVGAMAAADAAALASAGLGASDIASNLAQYGTGGLFAEQALTQAGLGDLVGKVGDAYKLSQVAGGLLGNQALAGRVNPLMGGASGGASSQKPRGAVDYTPTLSLLENRVRTPNVSSLLG
jgi:hypothetical protein